MASTSSIKDSDVQRATLMRIFESKRRHSNQAYSTSSSKVYDYVVRNICNRKFTGGMKLVERELASQLNMSHIPVREAMKELAYHGWIEQEPRKGAVVKEFSLKELHEIYMLREIVELGVIRRVAEKITAGQLSELKQVLDLINASNESKNFEVYRDADFHFHRLIVEFAGSERLLKFYETILTQIRFCCFEFWRLAVDHQMLSVTSLQSSVTHQMIYDALASHDKNWAEQVLKKHLDVSCSVNAHVLEMLAKSGNMTDILNGKAPFPAELQSVKEMPVESTI